MNLFSKLAALQQEQPQDPRYNSVLKDAKGRVKGAPPTPPMSGGGVSDLYADGLSFPQGQPTVPFEKPPLPTIEDAGGLLWRAGTSGLSPLGAAGLVGKKLYDMNAASMDASKKTVNAPPAVVPPPQPEEPPSDNAMKWGVERGMGSDLGLGDTMNLVQQLSKEAQARQGQQNKLRADFEGTPELDQLIAQARGQLDQAKGERKRPGLGEFLTLALMNLGNRDFRNNADMVLGLSQQQKKEEGLETLLNNLEGTRAGAKMQGRRGYQASQQKDRYSALERMMQTQEMTRKQQNADRDYGFKNQKMGADKLMQAIGQMRQQMASEVDPARKKALQAEIDRLDPYNPKNQKPKDDRQSRMFGDLLAGGGYA